MPTKATRTTPNENELIAEVVNAYVHRLFPDFRPAAYVACPDADVAVRCARAITQAAKKKGVASEIIDLRPAPATTLDTVTARLEPVNDRHPIDSDLPPRLLVLEGFDLLAGPRNDEPTYPFRANFQFDHEHLWLFTGRDWQKLSQLFGRYDLPLYHAASDITPSPWRTPAVSSRRKAKRAT
ncbi:MAG TPA: hypothetical protein VF292_13205 [Rhodanobacteraceae bacterium]